MIANRSEPDILIDGELVEARSIDLILERGSDYFGNISEDVSLTIEVERLYDDHVVNKLEPKKEHTVTIRRGLIVDDFEVALVGIQREMYAGEEADVEIVFDVVTQTRRKGAEDLAEKEQVSEEEDTDEPKTLSAYLNNE